MTRRSLLGALIRPRNDLPAPIVSRRGGSSILLPSRSTPPGEQLMRQYESVSTLHAIVSRAANTTAGVEWSLWIKAASGLKEDRVLADYDHPAWWLWRNPNPFYDQQTYVESVQQHVDLVGEGWPIVTFVGKIPVQLWFYRPDRMAPKKHPLKFLTGWTYTDPDGGEHDLKIEQAMQLKMPNPLDPYRGMGPVQSLLHQLDATKYGAEWQRNFFRNSAQPGGIVQVERQLTDDQHEEMTERWAMSHKGLDNAHRVAILENGATWVPNAFSMKDLQFVELANVSSQIIREAFGFPKFMLGDVDDVNRATADASDAFYSRWFLRPRLERWKGMLNNRYLPLFGRDQAARYEFDYADPSPPDRESERADDLNTATVAKVYVDMGATRESVQKELGLPDGLLWEAKPEPEPSAPIGAGRGVGPGNHLDRDWATGRMVATAIEAEALAPVQRAWERELDALLRQYEDLTEAQRDQLHAQIEQAILAGDLAALGALTVDTGATEAAILAALVLLATVAAGHVVTEAAAQGVIIATGAVAASVLVPVAAATASLLGQSLSNAAGREALRLASPSTPAVDVANGVIKHLRSLSDRYLRDELGGALTRAQNLGRLATLRAAPRARYYASEILDQNTCKPCANIDGEELPTLDAATLAYGGGPYLYCQGGVRCRGTMVAVWTIGEESP